MMQTLDDEYPIPAMGQMLAMCCELLSKKALMQYSFEGFMALWAAESGYGTDEEYPPAKAYEPIVRVAYSVLVAGGLILAPQACGEPR